MTTAKLDTGVQVREIPLDDLLISPDNPRKTFDPIALEELAATIRNGDGIQVPLIVRPQAAQFEIVCGHRRHAAAVLAELATAPCIVRELTDDQAREMALVDNLQRVDVPALEEAEAFGALLALHGTVEAVAARVGKDVAHVAKRLKLRTLGTWSVDALRERLITVDHALLLARLGLEEQEAILKWTLDSNAGSKTPVDKVIADAKKSREKKSWYREPQSPLRLKEHIEQHSGRKLSRAPWSLDDAELLPEAGACSVCPSNTNANTALFADLSIQAATCADGECFKAKTEAFVQIKLAHSGMPPGSAIRISWRATSVKPRWAKDGNGPSLTQVFKDGQWGEAKKGSCTNILTGVTVDWSDLDGRHYMSQGEKLRKPGHVLQVCVAGGCKAHRKEWEKAKHESSNARAPYDAKAEQEKVEKTRLAALAETKLRVRLAGAAVEKVTKLPEQLLRRFLIDELPRGDAKTAFEAICPGLEKAVRSAPLASVEFARAVATLSLKENEVEVWEHWEPTQYRKEFISALKLLGSDASKAWDKASEAKPAKPVKKDAGKPKKKAILSAPAKKRIADAQRKRWAAAKKAGRK